MIYVSLGYPINRISKRTFLLLRKMFSNTILKKCFVNDNKYPIIYGNVYAIYVNDVGSNNSK